MKTTGIPVFIATVVTAFGLILPISAFAQTPIPHIFEKGISHSTSYRCLVSICGPASAVTSVDNALELQKGRAKGFDKLWETKYAPLIKKELLLDKKSLLAGYGRALKLLRENRKIRDSQGIYAVAAGNLLVDLATSGGRELSDYLAAIDDEGWIVKVYDEKVNELIGKLNSEQLSAFKDLLEAIVAPGYSDHNSAYWKRIKVWQARLERKFPKLKREDALKAEAREQRRFLNLMTKDIGKSYSKMYAKEIGLLEAVERGEDLSADEMDSFSPAVNAFELFGYVLEPENIARFAKLPNLASKALSVENVKAQLEKTRSIKLDEQFERVKKSCYTKLESVAATQLTADELRRANSMIADVLLAADRVLRRWGNEWASDEVLVKLRSSKFSFDDQIGNHFYKFEEMLKDSVRTSQMILDDVKHSTDESDQALLKLLLVGYSEDEDDTSEAESFCDQITITSASDAAYTAKGRIRTSWYTALYPQYGAAIIAHELGHVLSKWMSTTDGRIRVPKKGSETYACVANRNPFVLNPVAAGLFQQTTWSEEDFADFFAAQVTLELRANTRGYHDTKNLGCALTSIQDGKYNPSSLAVFPPDKDGHSSSLMRAVFQAIDLGEITPQCAPFLNYEKEASRKFECQ